MTAPAAAATTPTSTALSPAVSRFSEARLVPDTLAMAWRSLITMVRNPGEFYDILIQPVMFTVLFGELFGGAIAGDVKAYLPTIVPGLIIMNALTTSQSVGVDLREDMDKGVFDRFKVLPISRIAPLAGPMVADLLRYFIASVLTFAVGIAIGYRPGGGVPGVGRVRLARRVRAGARRPTATGPGSRAACGTRPGSDAGRAGRRSSNCAWCRCRRR